MTDTPVASGQSAVAPGEKHVVHLTPAVQLWMIVNSEGKTFPAFNCGNYSAQPTNNLPGLSDGKQRTLQSSGCRLFSLVSYLGGVGVTVPAVVRGARQAGDLPQHIRIDSFDGAGPGVPLGLNTPPGPTHFLHYIWACIAKAKSDPDPSQDTLSTHLLYRDPHGAIPYNDDMKDLINLMISKANGGYLPRTFRFGKAQEVHKVPGGQEIPGLTAAIRRGHAVLLGVGTDKTDHFVLCVGMAKYNGRTYYVVTDSGFPPNDPNALLPMKTTDATSPYVWNVTHPSSVSRYVIGMCRETRLAVMGDENKATPMNDHFDFIFAWVPLEGDIADDWRVVSNVEEDEALVSDRAPSPSWNMVTNAPQTWLGFDGSTQPWATPASNFDPGETEELPTTPASSPPSPGERYWYNPWTWNN